MKHFYEIQFPTDIAYGATGGPEFFTDIVTSSSGYEQRNINWNHPRCRYNLAPAIKDKEQLDILLAFFRICQGKALGFRFKDWSDYQLNNSLVAIADGIASSFQLVKTYNFANQSIIRKISKPVLNTIEVYCSKSREIPEINYATGQLKFIQPPEKGIEIRVDGEFDVPVRFDIDKLATSIESYGVYSHQEIPLIELKI